MSATTASAAINPYRVDLHNLEKRSMIGNVSTGEGASFGGETLGKPATVEVP